MCTCDNDNRIRLDHEKFPEKCDYYRGADATLPAVTTDGVSILPAPVTRTVMAYDAASGMYSNAPELVGIQSGPAIVGVGPSIVGIQSGPAIVGVAGELLYTVTHRGGASLRWEDGSVMGTGQLPLGMKFRGVLHPHDLIEVTTPGYSGYVNLYETQQVGPVTSGDFETSGDEMAGYEYAGDAWGSVQPTCPSGQHWVPGSLQCVSDIPPPPVRTGWDPYGRHRDRDERGGRGRGRGRDNTGRDVADAFGAVFNPLGAAILAASQDDHPDDRDRKRREREGDQHRRHHVGIQSGPAIVGIEAIVGAAETHAENAVAQAHSAKTAAAHPAAQGTHAHTAAKASAAHATQAVQHAHAAQTSATHHEARAHETKANAHARSAASHAHGAHAEARRGGARGHEGRGGHGFGGRGHGFGGHGREGWGRGGGRWGRGWGRGGWDGRGWRRDLFSEWFGFGHPRWREGIRSEWMHWRAECLVRSPWGICFKERMYSPGGGIAYRVTPAGMQQGVVLEIEEQSQNDQLGIVVPDTDAGLLPGSNQSSDGSQETPEDADQQTAAADQAVVAEEDVVDPVAVDDAALADTATTGEMAGWQDMFTDPYGYVNPFNPSAYDSHYMYEPYWYNPGPYFVGQYPGYGFGGWGSWGHGL